MSKTIKVDQRFESIPLPHNPFFIGREALLGELHETLHLHQTVALSGLGGMGKTQIANHYTYLHRYEYQAILWAFADSKESLQSSLATIATVLGLPKKTKEAVKNWLTTHNDWLLILDKVNEVTPISLLLEGELGERKENLEKNRHILVTTGATTIEPLVSSVVKITEMSVAEGAKFFIQSDEPVTDQKIAEDIVHELGGLPLALGQASAYIRETQCCFSRYLECYRSYISKRQAKYKALATKYDYPISVAMTWLLSFEEITYEEPDAADLLRFCAFLHPNKIPLEIFQVFDIEQVDLDKLLTKLYKYSLLHYNPKTQILAIHPLAQAVLKAGMDESEQRIWAETVVHAVGNAVSQPTCENDLDYERLLPCVQNCAVLVEKWKITFGESNQFLEPTSVSCGSKSVDEEHSNQIQNLNNLASLYYVQGAYEKAKPLYEKALALCEKFLGKEHPSVAVNLNHLAGVYQAQGAYEQAKPLYEQALAIRETAYGREHYEVAQNLNYLAGIYQAEEEYEQAKLLYEQALNILNKLFEPNHQYVHWCQDNYARLLEKMTEKKGVSL